MKSEVPDYMESKASKSKKRKSSTRRQWIFRLMAIIFPPTTGWLYGKLESNWIELTTKSLPFKGVKQGNKIKLLHLSDFHLSKFVSLQEIEAALHAGFSEAPDACFITGDFITAQPGEEEMNKFSLLLRKYASRTPTFACLGNHDGGNWAKSNGGFSNNNQIRRLLAKSRVKLLHNEGVRMKIRGVPIKIIGVGDLWSKDCRPKVCMNHESQREPDEGIVLMCHNPDAKEILQTFYWNLMLSGHTHGGQFVIPFTKLAPFAPVSDHSMTEGLHHWGKNKFVHVTRGVGNLYGLRINCRPEISLVELLPEKN